MVSGYPEVCLGISGLWDVGSEQSGGVPVDGQDKGGGGEETPWLKTRG